MSEQLQNIAVTEQQLHTIAEVVRQVKSQDPLYLHQPVTVRLDTNLPPLEIWGVQVSPKLKVYLLDGEGQWTEFTKDDLRADIVVGALYQRVRITFAELIKAKEVA